MKHQKHIHTGPRLIVSSQTPFQKSRLYLVVDLERLEEVELQEHAHACAHRVVIVQHEVREADVQQADRVAGRDRCFLQDMRAHVISHTQNTLFHTPKLLPLRA